MLSLTHLITRPKGLHEAHESDDRTKIVIPVQQKSYFEVNRWTNSSTRLNEPLPQAGFVWTNVSTPTKSRVTLEMRT